MSSHRLVSHGHQPIYRVVRAGWTDPLDASFSQTAPDNRWNTREFPALYCCCGLEVARAVTRDILRFAGVEVEDLQPGFRPRLVEIEWAGQVVDVVSPEGVAAAGFPDSYPEGVSKRHTRELAAEWHRQAAEGVVCRSASLHRLGVSGWSGGCARCGELALYVESCATPPRKLRHRDDVGWLSSGADPSPAGSP
jgi:hypothetical protein